MKVTSRRELGDGMVECNVEINSDEGARVIEGLVRENAELANEVVRFRAEVARLREDRDATRQHRDELDSELCEAHATIGEVLDALGNDAPAENVVKRAKRVKAERDTARDTAARLMEECERLRREAGKCE